MERIWKEEWLEGMSNIKKSLSRYMGCPDRDSNRVPAEYNSRALPAGQPGLCMTFSVTGLLDGSHLSPLKTILLM